MDAIKSPVGHWEVRRDTEGAGDFIAPRGDRIHDGLDLVCYPGQDIFSPVRGLYYRPVDPYGNGEFSGMRICCRWAIFDMLYVEPIVPEGSEVAQGQIVAKAQDITARYGPSMTSHIHFRMHVDPFIFQQEELESWVSYRLANVFSPP